MSGPPYLISWQHNPRVHEIGASPTLDGLTRGSTSCGPLVLIGVGEGTHSLQIQARGNGILDAQSWYAQQFYVAQLYLERDLIADKGTRWQPDAGIR